MVCVVMMGIDSLLLLTSFGNHYSTVNNEYWVVAWTVMALVVCVNGYHNLLHTHMTVTVTVN